MCVLSEDLSSAAPLPGNNTLSPKPHQRALPGVSLGGQGWDKGRDGFFRPVLFPVSGGGPVFAETIFILYLGHTCVVLPRRRCKPDLQAPRTGRRVAQGWDLGPSFQASVPRVRVRGLTWPSRWGTKAPSCHRVYIFFLNSK